jgi:lipopolysaccharide/colanic/teichoic acid biosynthesis glycosyltransferase
VTRFSANRAINPLPVQVLTVFYRFNQYEAADEVRRSGERREYEFMRARTQSKYFSLEDIPLAAEFAPCSRQAVDLAVAVHEEIRDAAPEDEGRRFAPQCSPSGEELRKVAQSEWSTSAGKRIFDMFCVTPAILVLSPLVVLISAAVRITSDGPILFRQNRIGKGRKVFTIYKFRTMYHDASRTGPSVTKAGDPRLTCVGSFLRRYKLDEIPQLYNVLRGDMSLVGPRPKLARFEHAEMGCRPGLTGAATLAFAREEELLKNIPEAELDSFHMEVLSPIKAGLDNEYQSRATFASDLGILFNTLLKKHGWISWEDNPALSVWRADSVTTGASAEPGY